MSNDSKYFFRNKDGNSPEGSIKLWWKRNAKEYNLEGKRLDYLRKTGSTIVARYERGIEDFYLGEALKDTAKINYTFNDGEPCHFLDAATDYLGSEFGFSSAPYKMQRLTPEMIEVLKEKGFSV